MREEYSVLGQKEDGEKKCRSTIAEKPRKMHTTYDAEEKKAKVHLRSQILRSKKYSKSSALAKPPRCLCVSACEGTNINGHTS